ncbi:MAG TPA: alkaline phosphatase family protein [Bryobacteraceae bacterium]|nr:alkaline phosphatase family protein [Bryobacteraceae bacterium]
MPKRFLVLLLGLCAYAGAQQRPAAPQTTQPKLVLAIVVDQFRYDYLTRFRAEFTGGLKRLLEQGAVFTNAYYDASPTVTAVGHSTFMTGATPAKSGIIGNQWWDRAESKVVTSVSDDKVMLLGGKGSPAGSSPARLLVSTVGDELKNSGKGGKVIGISLKDRSAILPAGRKADGAYWFDGQSGNFVSSTYYFPELPAWVREFNATRPADQYAGQEWLGHKLPGTTGPQLYNNVDASPFGDELLQSLALRAMAAENLGTGSKTDVLAISYSSVDYVGHRDGPDSPEIHDMVKRVDKLIGALIDAAEVRAGRGSVLVVFSADHGSTPVPEENQKRGQPGGRIQWPGYRAAAEKALTEKFGAGQWISFSADGVIYFNPDPIPGKKLLMAEIQNVAADTIRAQPHIARVYTKTQLAAGVRGNDPVDLRVRNGFYPDRAPDIFTVTEPYYIFNATGTTHGSPYEYDTHVPVIFLGSARIRAGSYPETIGVEDVAPTLARLLGIQAPSGNMGHVLARILK